MPQYYSKAQIDSLGTVIGNRISTATNPATLATAIDALADRNLLTDAERNKLSGLESSRFLGTFLNVSSIPVAGAGPGSYADVDGGAGQDVQRFIFDTDLGAFVASAGQTGSVTAAQVKTLYESNANTNEFSDALRTRLENLTEAVGITDFTAALDAAIA